MIPASTTPMMIAAMNVTQIEDSRAISAAASDEITRKVRVVASRATRSASRMPDRPATTPQPNQADASTRRTGTPSVAVISRSLAIARIAVPSREKRRNSVVATVIAIPTASAMTSVVVTWIWPTRKPWLSVGSEIDRDAPPLDVHNRSIVPSRMSVRPSVAVVLTRGSRPASARPNTIP